MRRQIVFGLCVLVLSSSGILADVLPAKPSATVVLIPTTIDEDEEPQTCWFTGEVVNVQLQPDGTPAPFSIPAGHAFMITGVDFVNGNSNGGVPTGDRIGYLLRTVDGGLVIAEGYARNTGLPGPVSGSTSLSTPMRVTSALCLDRTVGSVTGGTRTWIRGFLIQNK